MNRIDLKLTSLHNSGKKALSPYITAGCPSLKLTVPLMHKLVESGADLLEIGVPFSDPMAEGSVIQGAMERALANGVSCKVVLDMIAEFRELDDKTPIVLMGYLNPIEQMGYETFAKTAHASGVDGTILVDLPPEESIEINSLWQKNGIHPIYLCSPTTSDERMTIINEYGQGYLYYVSLKGVTGSDSMNLDDVKQHYHRRKQQATLPVMVGFGIKTAEMAANVGEFSDGVVVGAALINEIQQAYSEKKDPLQAGYELIKNMRLVMDRKNNNQGG